MGDECPAAIESQTNRPKVKLTKGNKIQSFDKI